MADEITPPAPRKRAATPRKPASAAAKVGTTAAKPRKPAAAKPAATGASPAVATPGAAAGSPYRTEAKSRFDAAVREAKAGAQALKAEAGERAALYRDQAKTRGKDWSTEARAYTQDAKVKGKELATQGKGKVSEGLTALGQAVADSAQVVDEKLGAKYGDYARTASRGLQDAATRLDQKSIDDLGEDARAFVRKSPGAAVGIAAVFGFLLSRLFSGSRR